MGASLWHRDARLLQGLCPCDLSALVDWEKGCRMPLPSPEMMLYKQARPSWFDHFWCGISRLRLPYA